MSARKGVGALVGAAFPAALAAGKRLSGSQHVLDEFRALKRDISRLRRDVARVREAQRELLTMQGLGWLPLRYPLFLGAWSIDPFHAREIVQCLERLRPKTVLEIGSGASTVIVAATLRQLGLESRHIAVDHLEEFLDATRRQLDAQGLGGSTELWHCPLAPDQHEGIPWYGELKERLDGASLDLVIVDGPPAAGHPLARQPALPILRSQLNAGAVVLLDDAARSDERRISERWRTQFPELAFELEEHGKGVARFEVPSPGQ